MTTSASSIRSQLGHPVVDVDGHIVEALPVLADYVRRVAGDDVAQRFLGASPAFSSRSAPVLGATDASEVDPRPGVPMTPWWALPADTRDRATAFLPRLLHERLDELGIDFTVLYPSVALAFIANPDDRVRIGGCRALNTYVADMLDGLGDRMTGAAAIPTHTPEEAIAVLEHAVMSLGFKVVMLNSYVLRPVGDGRFPWYDVLALDSIYDYDPVWQRCVDLRVALTVHSPAQDVGLRQSSSRYMFNHIGNFAASSDAFAKALFFGGVTRQFPNLNVAFLECGVTWGVQLLGDLVDRWRKRGGPNIERLDPARIDPVEWNAWLDAYGGPLFADPAVRDMMRGQSDNPPEYLDDFRDAGIERVEDIAAHFDRFFFGCEADDPLVAWAFRTADALGVTLRPVLGSDLGHWDVTDMGAVVPEAYELVTDGQLTAEQFRAFVCDNGIRLHGGMNPAFFEGTRVAAYARALLASPECEGARSSTSS